MSERSIICPHCVGAPDPMKVEWSGWRGDCAWWLRVTKEPGHDPEGTCSYGCWDEPVCQTGCPDIEPGGWGNDPGPQPCDQCGGVGVLPRIVSTDPRWSGRKVFV